jgi:hypothetical protein
MLEPKEARKVYESLSKILTDEGLEWLLQDVQRQIALGKQSTKEIQVESTVGASTAGHHTKKKGRPAKFIVTQPYSEREKLILLVEAIEAASVGLSRGILNTYEVIGEHLHNLDALGFAYDTEESELRYVKRDFLDKKKAVFRLDELLHELKEAI